MRPGWADALRMSASRLPHARLLRHRRPAGARGGPAGDRAGDDRHRPRQGVHLRDLHPGLRPAGHLRPAGPARAPRRTRRIVERTFGSINTLFCQHVAGYTGSQHDPRGGRRRRGRVDAAPSCRTCSTSGSSPAGRTGPTTGCATRCCRGGRCHPNEKYAALVAAAGYLPVALSGEDYLELLPVALAGDQRLRHPDRPPHLRLRRAGPAAGASTPASPPSAGCGRSTTTPTTCPRSASAPPDGWITVALDAPADGLRAVRRLHLAPRPPPGRRAGRTTPTRPRSPGSSTTCSPAPQHGPATRPAPGSPPAPAPPPAAHRPSRPSSRPRRTRSCAARTTARTTATAAGDPAGDLRRRRRGRKVVYEPAPPRVDRRRRRDRRRSADHQGRLAAVRRPPARAARDCSTPPSWRALTRRERADYDEARLDYHADLPW